MLEPVAIERKYTKIRKENFDNEVFKENLPVLLAYIRKDHAYREQTELMMTVQKNFNNQLKIGLVDEYSTELLQKLQIAGSPTYIVFKNGVEQGRMLGKADDATLSAFLIRYLPEFESFMVGKSFLFTPWWHGMNE